MQKESVVVKKSCHSRVLLSGIYNACRCPKKEKTLLNNCVEDPRLRPSGMTPNLMGFTLIELLVVVLIIGILAAVAVPQYQKAVVKSEYAKLKVLATSIAQAQEVYYLSNGQYASSFEALDIDMPGGKLDTSVTNRYEYEWGNCFTSASDALSYCRDYHTNMYYQVYHQHTTGDFEILAGQKGCGTFDLSSVKMQICQQETGKTDPDYTGKAYALWIYE